MQKDINNQLYAGSVDNSIFIDGQKVNTNFIAGWEILGVETYIDSCKPPTIHVY